MERPALSWEDSLAALVKGNERFVVGLPSADALIGHVKLRELAKTGQRPFATILSCSDSRVPAELLFDCGFGDLFVVRVAGNVVQPTQVASIEYAAEVLGTSLCVVMGHSQCGAVQATIDSELGKGAKWGPNIDFLIELIRPSVQHCLRTQPTDTATLSMRSVRENVRRTSQDILGKSSLLRGLAAKNMFHVVEAVFQLETGRVVFEVDRPSTTA